MTLESNSNSGAQTDIIRQISHCQGADCMVAALAVMT